MGGFDPAFASASPGTLTVSRAIASAQRDQLAEFDFLRGGEAYKYRFGAINRFNVGRRFSSGIVAA
jgi:CelD/BcsL family acetyltransferase involved in cellulose biosynthesis